MPSVDVVAGGWAPPSVVLMEALSGEDEPWGLFNCDVGTRCCTMVLLTANLCVGWAAPAGVDSDVRALRTELCVNMV